MTAIRYLGREALRTTTAPALLCNNAKTAPDDVAYYVLDGDTVSARTWKDYASRVSQVAMLFGKQAIRPGDRVAIYADLCEEWMICDMAAQSIGAIVCGIYPTSSQQEVATLLRSCTPVLALAGSAAQATKLLNGGHELAGMKIFVISDGLDLGDRVQSFSHALATVGESDLDWLRIRAGEIKPEMPAFIVFTSGTGGDPKGALVAHGKHLAAASTMIDHFGLLRSTPHTTAVYLPPCHVLGRNFAITLPLISGLQPFFGGPSIPLPVLLRQAKPTVMLFVPRILQKFAAQVIASKNDEGVIARWLFRTSTAISGWHQSTSTHLSSWLQRLSETVVLRPVLRKIGFDRLELVICGGAAAPSAAMTFWHRMGVNVVQGYGTTETAGAVIAAQNGRYPRTGSVGTAPKNCELKLDESGEILVRHPDVFEKYWNDDEATKAAKLPDGWLRTGDIGRWENGELILIDRARDFLVTSGGKTLAPSVIENALRGSPFVAEAIVFGHGRKYLTALLELDFDAVKSWARAQGHQVEGPLTESHVVQRLMRGEVSNANDQLARVEQIKDFRLIPRALQPGQEGEPITATRKVRRTQMYLSFSELVESMYDDSEERLIASTLQVQGSERITA